MSTLDSNSTTSGAANFYTSQNIGNDQYVVRINDLSTSDRAKNVAVAKVVADGVIYFIIVVRNVAVDISTPTLPGQGGVCSPTTGICFEERLTSLPPTGIFSMDSADNGNPECTGDQAPPAGFSQNYDIEREADFMRELSSEIDANTSLEFIRDMEKALLFGLLMAPRSFYDLKTNVNWLSSADAGNYNYGYLGSALGLEKSTLIEMSGFVQFVSDELQDGGSTDYPFLDNLRMGLMMQSFAAFENIPEDPDQIESGYDAEQSGCTPNTNPCPNTNDSGSGGGGSSGWSNSGGSYYIGGSGCLGNCEIPEGSVTITDIEQP